MFVVSSQQKALWYVLYILRFLSNLFLPKTYHYARCYGRGHGCYVRWNNIWCTFGKNTNDLISGKIYSWLCLRKYSRTLVAMAVVMVARAKFPKILIFMTWPSFYVQTSAKKYTLALNYKNFKGKWYLSQIQYGRQITRQNRIFFSKSQVLWLMMIQTKFQVKQYISFVEEVFQSIISWFS